MFNIETQINNHKWEKHDLSYFYCRCLLAQIRDAENEQQFDHITEVGAKKTPDIVFLFLKSKVKLTA